MVVPNPLIEDYNMCMDILQRGYNDTEEKLLNDVFRNRWKPLDIEYNCQKRAFKLAPKVWNTVHLRGIKVIHYVGSKPWQSIEEMMRLDWEIESFESIHPYKPLFDLWRHIMNGNICADGDVTTGILLEEMVPLAPP